MSDEPRCLLPELREIPNRPWGITGFYREDGMNLLFGGSFLQDKFLGGTIVGGQLVDVGKVSEILEGGKFIPERELHFTKRYCRSGRLVDYEFHFENGIWAGRYLFPGHTGIAKCVIQPLTD